MLTPDFIRDKALAYTEVEESPHFEKISFRVRKKIFVTVDLVKQKVVLKLPAVGQSVFCDYKPDSIYPVAGAWGKQGWTVFDMKGTRKDLFTDALRVAYCCVAPKTLAQKYQPKAND